MQKLSYENEFLSFIFRMICEKGGTRMQLSILDITKEMQKLDALDKVNLHRKQYGNTEAALKAMKNQCFYIDNIVVKMKDRSSIDQLFKSNLISTEDYEYYVQVYEENALKRIDVMRINNQNKCKVLVFFLFMCV